MMFSNIKRGACKDICADLVGIGFTLDKTKVILDSSAKLKLFEAFWDANRRNPEISETFVFRNIEYKIGQLFYNIKRGACKDICVDLVRIGFTLDKTNVILDSSTKVKLFEAFWDVNRRNPEIRETFVFRNIEHKIGKMFYDIKRGACKDIHSSLLSIGYTF